MRYAVLLGSALLLGACASSERQIPAGSTVIYDSATKGGPDWFSLCDQRGNLLYISKDKSQPVVALKDGCVERPVAAPKEAPAPAVSVPAPASAIVEPAPGREPIMIQIVPAPGTEVHVAPAPKSLPKGAPAKPVCPPCK